MRSVAHASVFSYSSYCKCEIMLKRDDAKWLRSTKRSAFTLNAFSLPNLHCHPCKPVPALQHERSKRMKGRGASHPSESALGAPRHISPSALLLCTFCFTSLRRSLPVTAQVGRNPIFFFLFQNVFLSPTVCQHQPDVTSCFILASMYIAVCLSILLILFPVIELIPLSSAALDVLKYASHP